MSDDEYTSQFRGMVLDWMELPTKEQVFAAVAAHDAEVARAARVLPSVEDGLGDAFEALTAALNRGDHSLGMAARAVMDQARSAIREVATALADAPTREQVEREAAEKALRDAADDPAVAGYVHNNQAGNARAYMRARADRLAAGGEA